MQGLALPRSTAGIGPADNAMPKQRHHYRSKLLDDDVYVGPKDEQRNEWGRDDCRCKAAT
jgi:hypothetical protein